MARFLFFLRFARCRRRLHATLRLLRSAEQHLVSTPASQERKDKAMDRLLRRLRIPLDAGGYNEHGLLTVEQIELLHNETSAFLSAEAHFKEEAAHLHHEVTTLMIPATVAALGSAVTP